MIKNLKVFFTKLCGEAFSLPFFRFLLFICSNRVIGQPRLNILNYHRVLSEHDPLQPDYVTVEQFEKEMSWVSKHCRVLSLGHAVHLLKNNKLPRSALAITFDDGYADNYDDALPILKRLDLPATFFVTVGYLNNNSKWDVYVESIRNTKKQSINLCGSYYELTDVEKRAHFFQRSVQYFKGLPDDQLNDKLAEVIEELGKPNEVNLMMDDKMLKLLSSSNGVEIGAHGVQHQILSRVSSSEALYEIAESKRKLEGIINKRITGQAYPNGLYPVDFNKEHIEMTQGAGYSYAVSTNLGSVGPSDDLYRMSRIGPWRRDKAGFLLGLAVNYWRGQS